MTGAAAHGRERRTRSTTRSAATTRCSGSTGQGEQVWQNRWRLAGREHPVAIWLPDPFWLPDLRAGEVEHREHQPDRRVPRDLRRRIQPVGPHDPELVGTDWGDAGFGTIAWKRVGTDVIAAHTIDGIASSTTKKTTTTKPTMGAVEVAVPSGKTVSDTCRCAVKWSANSSNGISRYVIWTSIDGGSWVDTMSRLVSGKRRLRSRTAPDAGHCPTASEWQRSHRRRRQPQRLRLLGSVQPQGLRRQRRHDHHG